MLLHLHPETPQPRLVSKIAEHLKAGGVIIYPTDTIYGLGCDIYNHKAIERICKIKNIEPQKAQLSFICRDLSNLSDYTKSINTPLYRILKSHLPGPYTFILPAAKEVPKKLWSKRKTVGIRVPNHAVSLKLVEELGNPIISTSTTNRHGEILIDPFEIKNIFNAHVDLMLASGNLSGDPSSVVDLSEDEPEIIREGAGDVSLFV